MHSNRTLKLDRPVEPQHDHVLGAAGADITLVEYGSYLCSYCQAAHDVIRHLRDELGDRMRYVYRHLPLTERTESTHAAEMAEYVAAKTGRFWDVHDALMTRRQSWGPGDLDAMAAEFDVAARDEWDPGAARAVAARVRADARSGLDSGARVTPTFFINGRRYEGAWDEASLKEALLRSLGHRLHAASVDFARWAPSTGILLLLMTVAALVISNSPFGSWFLALWETPVGVRAGGIGLELSLRDWIDDGLLTIFFLLVGLEIKRELTVGRLAARSAAALPLAAATGGMIMPALLFLLMAPPADSHAWGMTITTDTAFAVALIVLLGDRVPVDLRVFLTAAVIVDDLVAILIVAIFYADAVSPGWLAVSAIIVACLAGLNRGHIYRALPYGALGVFLWFALHESGVHATLAGVVLAMTTPTRPPANLGALLAQAQAVIDAETRLRGDAIMRSGPAEPALRALDAIHDRIESPASKLLRAVEPWSSYAVLPLFALANAGVGWDSDVLGGHQQLMAATAVALVVGKFTGILLGAAVAVWLGVAVKPRTYTWRQLAGSGALAGIGFTMSLFIAGQALAPEDFAAAKVAIFLASLTAGALGVAILWKHVPPEGTSSAARHDDTPRAEIGTPVG